MFIILCLVLSLSLALNQTCNASDISVPSDSSGLFSNCPEHAYCLPNNYCSCDTGYIGDCSQPSFLMEDQTQISTIIDNQQYTYFEIIGDEQLYTELSFTLCHQGGINLIEEINVWRDDGEKETFNQDNSEPGGKSLRIQEGCMSLSTPFILFGQKPNGQTEGFILGLRLKSAGEVNISLKVTIEVIDFWGLIVRLLSVIGGCFLLIIIFAVGYLIYKWRRRELIFVNSSFNRRKSIAHFEQYLPLVKMCQQQSKAKDQEVCSVCLLQFQNNWIRKTPCSHVFHQECLDEWCKTNLSCPICRKSFELSALKCEQQASVTNDGNNIREVLL